MALTFIPFDNETMTLSELIHKLDQSPVLEALSRSEYADSAFEQIGAWLAATARERKSIIERICVDLNGIEHFQDGNLQQSPAYELYRGKNYDLRLLLWAPDYSIDAEKSALSYGRAHDHAFDLMTVGFYGEGYRTRLYDFDMDKANLQPDAEVDLRHAQELTLEEGRIIYYFAHKDVHTQYEPHNLSASLNIVIPKAGKQRVRQTVFELDPTEPFRPGTASKAQAHYNNVARFARQRSIFALLASTGDARSLDIVLRIAKTHSSEEVRALAWSGLLRNEVMQEHYGSAMNDPSSYVQSTVSRSVNS
jgi:hypothetical protein